MSRYLTKENTQEVYPLSPVQQGMLFHALLEPEAGEYLEQAVLTFEGEVDPALMQRAWEHLVERHPILRTVFYPGRKGQPLQIVLKRRPIALAVDDLSGLDPAPARRRLAELAAADAERPFSPTHGPLMRLRLVLLTPRRAKLVWTLDHLILDGWSSQLLVSDLLSVYDALAAGQEPPEPVFPPYRDYVAWLGRQDAEEARDFWRRRLSDLEAPTPLGADRRPVDGARRVPAYHDVRLSRELTAALAELARRLRVTSSTVLQAAWGLFLGRWSGEGEAVFGITVSGRPAALAGSERMVGPFINTLPVRLRPEPGQRLDDLLHLLQEQLLAATAYDFLSLAEIQAASGIAAPRRLFDSILVFHNHPGSELVDLEGRHLRLIDEAPDEIEGRGTSHYDLSLEVVPGERLRLIWIYRPEVFDAATLEAVGEAMAALLESFAAAPGRRLEDLSSLGAGQRRRLLETLQEPLPPVRARPPGGVCELVAAHARARPHAVAASAGGRELSYGELERRADRTARWLRGRSLGREDRVAVLGHRGLELLVSVLAIAKAGAVYLPLDPAHPDARLATILADSRPRLAVAPAVLIARAVGLAAAQPSIEGVLCWDELPPGVDDRGLPLADRRDLERRRPESPPRVAGERDLANVFYTSGSTGVPKGAMVDHGGLLNHLWAKVELLGLDASSAVAQNASIGFDISVWQMLAPLLAGGRVVFYDEEASLEVETLLERAARDAVTVLETVPSLLELMLSAARPELELPRLRYLVSNAETLPVDLAGRWLRRFPTTTLLNTYGATECSDDTTHHPLAEPLPAAALRVPVGRPIPGFRTYVVDRRLELVALTCPGQVAMAGAGVGRGYLGDARKTAAVFVPDPFAAAPGGRLYLSGDRGRLRGAGELEYLGRLDHQVKVRGQRVEPGEVEAALGRLEGVRQAAVVAREDPAGSLGLSAYLVLAAGVEVEAVQGRLRRELPAHMVPELWVRLDALPLTPNGKVDRRALPAAPASAVPSAAHTAPRDELERTIAEIWREVLEVEQVGVEDDFFALGGQSLKVLQVRSRLRHELSVELPLRELFEHPTLEELARHLRPRVDAAPREAARGGAPTPGLQRLPEAPHYLLSHAQRRLWLRHRMEPESPVYNMTTAFEARGELDLAALERALETLVARHESLRTRFRLLDGEPVQEIVAPAAVRPAVEDLSARPEAERRTALLELARAERLEPFDLGAVPARWRLVRLAADRHLLLWTLHHVITDAWSWAILERELEVLYRRFRSGEASPLEPLPIRYVDFAAWQRKTLEGPALESLEGYWLSRLGDRPEPLELPLDRPRPRLRDFRAGVRSIAFGRDLSEGVEALARAAETTSFTVLLAAAAALLGRLAGRSDVVLGTTASGRTLLETEGLVGFFVTTLVLRTELAGDPSFDELVARVKRGTLEAYEHQDYPFDLLVERLNPPREAGRSPLFQVLVDRVEEEPPEKVEERALRPVPLPAAEDEELAVDFDLELHFVDRGGLLGCSVRYARELYDAVSIQRLLGCLRSLLGAAAAGASSRVGELRLTSEAERHQLVHGFNATARGGRPELGLYQLFEQRARACPERLALVAGEAHLSYGELARRAGLWAEALLAAGIGPEAVVGVHAGRSAERVVGLLAVLAAGGAYLPLDPALPSRRLAFMLGDARCQLVLTDAAGAGRLAELGCRRLRLGPEPPPAAGAPSPPPAVPAPVSPDSAAYVIYTSGSTGRPKGVVTSHRAIVNRLLWMQESYSLQAGERVLQKTPLSFDVSVWELFWPLLVGAVQEVARPGGEREPAYLARLLRERRVGTLHFVPSMLRAFLDAPAVGEGSLAPRLITSGEALTERLARRAFERLPGLSLHNLYGPTEAAVDVTAWPVSAASLAAGVPIGRPVANTRIHVLDRRLEPVPIGFAGELWIGGVQLARGYLARPALTAERFVPDPFGTGFAVFGGRLYRTGDRARHRGDGAVEYLGRLDSQVKVRGQRVELGEIEAALAGHPAVREAAVVVRADPSGEPMLAAYVAAAEAEVDARQLASHLRARLPEVMVPAAFVFLGALPLTASGKLDRRALPAPAGGGTASGGYAPPRSELELELVGLWEATLGRPAIGVHDDFFGLGGHSLKAAVLVNRLAERFGVELPLAALFEAPTVAAFARRLEAELGEREERSARCLVPLAAPAVERPPLYLVHPHVGEVFAYHPLARILGRERPIFGLRSPGLADGEQPLESIAAMARRYVEEVRRHQPEGPYRLAGWSYGGLVAFEMARHFEAGGAEVAWLGILDTSPADPRPRPPGEVGVGRIAAMFFGLEEAAFEGLERRPALELLRRRARGHPLLAGSSSAARLDRLVRVLEANTRAFDAYRTEGRVDADLHLFQAAQAPRLQRPERWRTHTRGELHVARVPGDHHGLMAPPGVEVLAAEVDAALARASPLSSVGVSVPGNAGGI